MRMPIRFILSQIFHVQNKRLRPYISEAGLTSGQPKVLDYLSFHEGCTQKEIAKGCGVEPATMSGILNGLVDKGYVTKKTSLNNRREFRVLLTDLGREKHVEIRKRIEELESETMGCFTNEEKVQFQSYLERYYEALEKSFEKMQKDKGAI